MERADGPAGPHRVAAVSLRRLLWLLSALAAWLLLFLLCGLILFDSSRQQQTLRLNQRAVELTTRLRATVDLIEKARNEASAQLLQPGDDTPLASLSQLLERQAPGLLTLNLVSAGPLGDEPVSRIPYRILLSEPNDNGALRPRAPSLIPVLRQALRQAQASGEMVTSAPFPDDHGNVSYALVQPLRQPAANGNDQLLLILVRGTQLMPSLLELPGDTGVRLYTIQPGQGRHLLADVQPSSTASPLRLETLQSVQRIDNGRLRLELHLYRPLLLTDLSLLGALIWLALGAGLLPLCLQALRPATAKTAQPG